jgi:O-antigen/teichoic acid export membrane protein
MTTPALDHAPKQGELGRSAIRNGIWTIGSYSISNVIRLVGNLVITHLLAPQWIGVMALVTTMVVGIRLFSDLGIGPALISNPRGTDERFLRTAYAMQLMRGVFIWLIACLLAIPVAWYYSTRQDPIYSILAIVMPVAGFQAVLESMRSTSIYRLQRMLDLRKGAMLDVIEISINTSVMVTWAWIHPTIWALVIPGLIGCGSVSLISHFFLRDRVDRPQWHADCAKELIRVGRWIFMSTALAFLGTQFAPLIFGRLVDPVMLAIYWIAMSMAMMPYTALARLGSTVLFPTFSRVAQEPERFAYVYGKARTLITLVGGMVVCGMIATSPFGIRMLYKPAYDNAGIMLQLLALSVWFQILDTANVAGLLARQRADWMVAGNLTKVVFMFGLVPLVYYVAGRHGGELFGFLCALVALGCADVLRACVGVVGLRKTGLPWHALKTDFVLTPLIAAIGVGSYLLTSLLAPSIEAHFASANNGTRLANAVLFAISSSQVLAIFVPAIVIVWKKSRTARIIAE